MKEKKIIISGTGCALADYLYTGVQFTSPEFQKYLSKQSGDGGLFNPPRAGCLFHLFFSMFIQNQ